MARLSVESMASYSLAHLCAAFWLLAALLMHHPAAVLKVRLEPHSCAQVTAHLLHHLQRVHTKVPCKRMPEYFCCGHIDVMYNCTYWLSTISNNRILGAAVAAASAVAAAAQPTFGGLLYRGILEEIL